MSDNEEVVELSCPVCWQSFPAEITHVREIYGGITRTDFRPQNSRGTLTAKEIYICPRCGYAGYEADFDGVDLEPHIKGQIWNELSERVGEYCTAAEKYELAAKTAEICKDGRFSHTARLYLDAAWAADDDCDLEAERFYRIRAARAYCEALDAFDDIPYGERARITYLIGELWRRIGDIATACYWFDRVSMEILSYEDEGWLIDAAEQQKRDPREFFNNKTKNRSH